MAILKRPKRPSYLSKRKIFCDLDLGELVLIVLSQGLEKDLGGVYSNIRVEPIF